MKKHKVTCACMDCGYDRCKRLCSYHDVDGTPCPNTCEPAAIHCRDHWGLGIPAIPKQERVVEQHVKHWSLERVIEQYVKRWGAADVVDTLITVIKHQIEQGNLLYNARDYAELFRKAALTLEGRD